MRSGAATLVALVACTTTLPALAEEHHDERARPPSSSTDPGLDLHGPHRLELLVIRELTELGRFAQLRDARDLGWAPPPSTWNCLPNGTTLPPMPR